MLNRGPAFVRVSTHNLIDGPPLPGVATPRGRHSQGAYTNIRCCSAEVYTGDPIRLKYNYIHDAVLLKYIRAVRFCL